MSLPLPFIFDTPLFLSERPAANNIPSKRDATVSTPPTIAHVLLNPRTTSVHIDRKHTTNAYEVRKCAKDCRVSTWTTLIGEISKLKKAPG